jgi:flagellar motor protein MotB
VFWDPFREVIAMTIHSLTRVCCVVLLALVAFTGLTGCNKSLKQERNDLYLQNQELQDELNRAREALDAERTRAAGLESQLTSASSRAAAPTAAANTGFAGIEGVEVIQGVGQISVRVPGDVLFSPGKVDLKPTAQRTLDQIAAVIQGQYAANTIRVEGYTDTDPIRRSKWTDNLELSLQRSAAVHRYLQKRGISADRMYAAGFGETHRAGSKAQSRRVEIVVVQ